MLEQIHISNFTIIENLTIDLHPGTTVITGETGAGKSILIDAIELALGQRTSKDLVRKGANRADISVSFCLKNNTDALTWLTTNELEQDDNCIIRRTLQQDGKSRCYINDIQTTLQNVRSLVELLINIHGQHEYQTLLKPDVQLQILDYYAKNISLLTELNAIFTEWKTIHQTLMKLNEERNDRETKTEFLKFQLTEFENLQLQENEIEQLDKDHKTLNHTEELLTIYQNILTILSDEESNNVISKLNSVLNFLRQIQKITQEISPASELIENALIQINEAISECRSAGDSFELDPARLEWLENRISQIHHLARKHNVSPENLLTLQHKLQNDLEQLDCSDETLQKLTARLHELELKYQTIADQLSKRRHAAAAKLDSEVTKHIQNLAMPKGNFSTYFIKNSNTNPSAHGNESIEFRISANPGIEPKAIQKVASGGELSRISLAIHVVCAQHMPAPTMVFDEVDVGIGGHTGDVVGALLRELGERHQTICITHLPQVASRGHQHLLVSKEFSADNTTSAVNYITGDERAKEIARMMGGNEKTSLAHAKDMLSCAL